MIGLDSDLIITFIAGLVIGVGLLWVLMLDKLKKELDQVSQESQELRDIINQKEIELAKKDNIVNDKLHEKDLEMNELREKARAKITEISLAHQQDLAAKDIKIGTLSAQLTTLSENMNEQKTNETKLNDMLNNAINKTLTERNDSLLLKNKEAFDTIVKPMKEAFVDLHRQTFETRNLLQSQIENQVKQLEKMTMESNKLANALTTKPKTAGNYGEIILENVLNAAGLTKDIDYKLQNYHDNSDGQKIIPDAEVRIPNNRIVIIDSKLSLISYNNYEEIPDENKEEKTKALKNFVKSVEDRVNELSDKHYHREIRESLDFVFMLIPNEAIYNVAMMADPKMAERAYSKKVAIISPATLYSVLLLIQNTIRVAKADKEIELVRENASKLHTKMHTFFDVVIKVGKSLNSAKDDFDELQKRLTSDRGGEIIDLTEKVINYAKASESNRGSLNKFSQDGSLIDDKTTDSEDNKKTDDNQLFEGM